MISAPTCHEAQLDSPLGRTSPVVKLAVAIVWLVGARVHAGAVAAGRARRPSRSARACGWARFRSRTSARALAPLWLAALGIGLFNTLFSPANLDPTAAELITIGPFRITEPALLGGVASPLRVIAIATVGAVFALTTDSTQLVDSLVQQARVPERFAYGALAAYQAIPRFAEDLATLRQARRIRGLRGGWHPRLLVASSCSRSATATARHSPWTRGPSGRCRAPRTGSWCWGPYDVWIALAGLFVAWAVLVIGR